jgi:hypothetical protein
MGAKVKWMMLFASGGLCLVNVGLILGDIYSGTYHYLYRDSLMAASNAVIFLTWKILP